MECISYMSAGMFQLTLGLMLHSILGRMEEANFGPVNLSGSRELMETRVASKCGKQSPVITTTESRAESLRSAL
jgi:hypothetical protein